MSYKVPKQKKTPACRQCRQRKIGCDRVKPRCGNCVKRNRQDCIYPEKKYGTVETYNNMYNTHNTINHNVNYHNHTLIATPMISNRNAVNNQIGANMMNNNSSNPVTLQNFGSLPHNFNNYNNNSNMGINIPIQKYYSPLLNSTTGTNIPLQTSNYNQEPSVPLKYGTQLSTHQFNTMPIKDTYKQQRKSEQINGVELNENLLNVLETIPHKSTIRNNTIINGNVNQEIDNRVQLLNANLDSLPSLFNPTNVSNIYDAKYISTTYSNKNKKNQQNNKKSNELENSSISNQSVPVFYDLMTSIYSQEEILLKEMDFLRDRYIQLLYYKSKYSDDNTAASTTVHKTIDSKSDSNNIEDEQQNLKRRKIEEVDSGSMPFTKINTSENVVNNNKIPLTLLGPYETLSISKDNAQNTKFPPTIDNCLNITTLDLNLINLKSKGQDSKLNRNFIILRDHYLTKFYEDLTKIMKMDFIPNLNEYYRSKFKVRNVCNTILNCQYHENYTFDCLKLLKVNLILEILGISCKTMPNANKIFYPILDFNVSNWMVKVIKLLNDSIEISGDLIQIPMKPMTTKDLSFIGIVIIIILFFYYSNKFSINKENRISGKGNSKPSYSKLMTSIEQNRYLLFYSLFLIKKRLLNEVVNNFNENTIKDILKFMTLYKLLDQIKYDNPMSIDNVDYNEDIMIALHFSINNIKSVRGKFLKSYWKVISNNYLKHQIFEGKIPILFVKNLSSMNYYEDKKSSQYIGYSNDDVSDIDTYNFYVSQLKIINYLYMDDSETIADRTIDELSELIKDMDDKYYKFMNLPRADKNFDLLDERCNNYEFRGSQRIDNSLQYYKIKLHLEYLIFLQLEMVKEDKHIIRQFDRLFETVIVPIILLIFPSVHKDNMTEEIVEAKPGVSNNKEDTSTVKANEKLDSKNEDVEEYSKYNFRFIRRKMYLLEDLLDILYSIYERFQNFENYQRYKINGGVSDTEKDTDKSKVLNTLNQNLKHLFIILYIILTSSPISNKFNHIENFRPVTKIFIILSRMGYKENIKSHLLSNESLVKDKVTGLLSYENRQVESKYMKITQQEYLTQIQNSNNGLRSITDLNSLGRYSKYLKILNHRLIDACQLNHMTDLDSWFNTNIMSENKEIDLSGFNISPQNVTKVFDVFFSSI